MPEPTLHEAITHATASLLRQQSPDGLWRSLYEGGPVHVASGLIATCLLEPSTPARFREEQLLVEGLLAEQLPTGGFCPYPGAPASRDTTRITLLALRLFARCHAGALGGTPRLEQAVRRGADAAEGFVEAGGGTRSVFLDLLADLFWDTCLPERSHELSTQPLSAEAAVLFLKSAWTKDVRNGLSTFARQAVPAIAILFEKAASRRAWVRLLDQLGAWVGRDTSRQALLFLEREVLKLQCRTGGWLWSVLGTTLNLLALHALGHSPRHPAVRHGLAFIHALRLPGRDGLTQQGWCNAELWDSSVVAATLTLCDVPPASFRAEALAAQLCREQTSDGLWAFGVGALEGDNDSSAVVLAALCRLRAGLPASQRREVEGAIRACVDALCSGQQADGGWGYGPEPHEAPYSFGARAPFGLETTLVDGSTADVTGRVLGGLLSARASGLLGPQALARVERAWTRAVGYLQGAQGEVGSWWGRWTTGYLSSLVFVLPVLRAGGVPPEAPWLRRALRFVRETQNADGGWGESTLADSDEAAAGRGPSTPVQTAYAVAALVALSTAERPGEDPAVRAGVTYLLRAQVMGGWHNPRALYTVAFRDDYFDADLMTQAMVLCVLRYVERADQVGAQAASEGFARGRTTEVPSIAPAGLTV